MKHGVLSIVCCAIMAATIVGHAFGAGFIHPGISHNQAELAFVKSRLKTQEQPWQESWEKMRSSKEATLSWEPKPVAHVERGANNRPNIGGSNFMDDAHAAYTHALLWVFTDTEAHALKAAEILKAWSATLESVSNHDAKLLVGMGGLQFCNAAELLKHTWKGWSQEDQQAFRRTLQKVLYPVIQDFFPAANGNWDASMIQTMMAMGIFLDDQAMFQKAVDYYLNGTGNGAVNHYFYDSGQCQESGRDQGHTQMGMEYLVNSAEIAWKQGIDLYSAYDNRLAKGFEYTAKYNQGQDVPFEYYESYQGKYKHTTIAEKSRGKLRPMYDKIVNHYHSRMGMDMPWSIKALEKTRPETGGTMPWSTLMYADQPSDLVKLTGTAARQQPTGCFPEDMLPPYITPLTDFGQRSEWSLDGKTVYYVDKAGGDIWKVDIASKQSVQITNKDSRPEGHGYYRVYVLANGDLLFTCGPERHELYIQILKKGTDGPPVKIDEKIDEGPAISRTDMKIVWTPDQKVIYSGKISYENGVPTIIEKKLIIDNSDVVVDRIKYDGILEPQNFRRPSETEVIWTQYGNTEAGLFTSEVMGYNLETGRMANYSKSPNEYSEPEGIFPDGRYTLIESDRHCLKGIKQIDIYKLKLDGTGKHIERLTHFNDVTGYKASNPVVSDDGKMIAFQAAYAKDAAGAGCGIYLLDLEKAAASASFPVAKNSLLNVNRNGRLISISCPVSSNISAVEVHLFSNANNTIIEYSDVSPYAPRAKNSQTGAVFDPDWEKKEEIDKLANRELRFPVVDIAIRQDMEAVFEIDINGLGEYCFNGNFRPRMHPIEKEIRIPADQVEHWENAMLLDPKSNAIQTFYIAGRANVADSKASFEFETLRDDWVGTISAVDAATKELLANAVVSRNIDVRSISTGSGVTRERMIHSLFWATKYILNCKNTNPNSPTLGGHFLLYDLAAKTRLRSDWPWSWGPSAQMLLKVSEIEEVDVGMTSGQLVKEAANIGMATLRQQILDKSHSAYGLVRTTIEPGTIRDCGFDNRASTADTLHLVGWGWMPLYKATKDRRFLEAAEKVADVAKRLMDESGGKMIPQAFDLKKMKWDDNMFFETSMGIKGLASLYLVTGEDRHRETMIRFVDMLLNAFEREDGLWEATLYQQTGKVSSCNFFTKSFGYCTDGLLAAHEAAPDRGYLKRIKKITEHVLKAQATDGSWSVRLDRPAEEVGVTDKGTALWAYLFMRLYETTGDKEYLTAGTKALEWCMDHQYFGDDTVARGGIVGRSWPSGIIYRHWFDMVTTYTVSFFGNALTEALSLDEWKAD